MSKINKALIPEDIDNITKLAMEGDAEMQYKLASIYEAIAKEGMYHCKAFYWYTKAAENGNSEAQFKLGDSVAFKKSLSLSKVESAMSIDLLTKAAKQGHIEAQISLGYRYYYSDGVDKNIDLAVKWWQKAAEQDSIDAQYILGYHYDDGSGKNIDLAVKWYRKAAEKGDDDAQAALGACYEYGEGVEKNIKTARAWYEKAVAQGNPNGKEALKEMRGKKSNIQAN